MFPGLARRAHTASPTLTSSLSRAFVCVVTLGLLGLSLAGCAQQPQQVAAAGHSKEYFPSSIYGAASRRVIADGQPVPRGGGQYLVGKPYTIAGQTYYPSERRVTQVGLASWYGDAFHGRLTANGEIYDRDSFTAAHPTMPLPSYARVTNLRNNTSMIVRVNDRGPYHSNRVMDVSRRVADALDIRRTGTAKVKVEWVARASLSGSDDAKLAATLRRDGPATASGVEEGIMLATAPARAVVASLGAFVPAAEPTRPAPRPARFVEQQRPSALEIYRAPPAAPSRAALHEGARVDETDDEPESGGRYSARPRHEEVDEDTETGSLRHHAERGRVGYKEQRVATRRDNRIERPITDRRPERHEQAHKERPSSEPMHRGFGIAQRGVTDIRRSSRGTQRMEAPLPPLRHPMLAQSRTLPVGRAVHVAAAATPSPVQKHLASPRSRSHAR